jgi:hypothetical protein
MIDGKMMMAFSAVQQTRPPSPGFPPHTSDCSSLREERQPMPDDEQRGLNLRGLLVGRSFLHPEKGRALLSILMRVPPPHALHPAMLPGPLIGKGVTGRMARARAENSWRTNY